MTLTGARLPPWHALLPAVLRFAFALARAGGKLVARASTG